MIYFDPDYIIKILLWMIFSGLPVGYWSIEALSKIASVVGQHMYKNRFITDMNRISFARVFVEVNVSYHVIESIEIVSPSSFFINLWTTIEDQDFAFVVRNSDMKIVCWFGEKK